MDIILKLLSKRKKEKMPDPIELLWTILTCADDDALQEEEE
jgi:hypothetical protein